MAVTSGSISTVLITDNRGIQRNLIFSWSRTAASGTTSTIAWQLRGGGTVTASDEKYVSAWDMYVKIDGTTKWSSSSTINLSYNTLVASGTFTETHSSTTSEKTFTAEIGGKVYTSVLNTQSGSWTLPAISTLSAAGMTLTPPSGGLKVGGSSNNKPSFNITNTTASLYYGLYWAPVNNGNVGSLTLISDSIVQGGSGLQTAISSWGGLNSNTASYFTAATGAVQVAFKLYTYKASTPSGSNIVGYTDYMYLDVGYDDSLKPSFSNQGPSLTDNSGYYNANSALLKTISSGTVSYEFSLKASAQLSSYSTKINGITVTATVTGSILKCQYTVPDSYSTMAVTFTVTDSRNLSTTITSPSYTCNSYTPPSVSLSLSRSGTTVTASGSYVRYAKGTGSLTLSTGETISMSSSSANGTFSKQLSGIYPINVDVTISATLNDGFNSTTISTTLPGTTGPIPFVLAEIHNSGSGISIGQGSENGKFIVSNMKVCLGLSSDSQEDMALNTAISNLGWSSSVIES